MKTQSVKPRRPREPAAKPVIHVVSDSTANLPRHTLTAMLTQFPQGCVEIRFHPFTKTVTDFRRAIGHSFAKGDAVCHAVISTTMKRSIEGFCKKERIACYDLTAGIVGFLNQVTGIKPRNDLKALHPIDQAYRQRIGAMEFTLNHDDGLGVETLHDADIVLAGVSRTGKTPTSILLAQQGYRVANVSLAMGVPFPAELLALPRRKVIALTINPSQLAMIRARRQAAWRMTQTSYDEPDSVSQEIAWCRNQFMQHGWSVLDVTDQAVEETAARIVGLVGLSGPSLSESACDLPALSDA